MKVSRSYLLGLGSGFILSAMLAVLITPLQGQVLSPKPSSTQIPQTAQARTTQTPPKSGTQQASSAGNETQEALSKVELSSIEHDFVIPQGSSLEWIANQLVAQGLVKNKDDFLTVAHQMGVEVKFKAGTFKLSLGLTPEEVIRRLLKS